MKKLFPVFLFCAAAGLMFLPACTVISTTNPKPQPVEQTKDNSTEIKLGDAILKSVQENSFAAFQKCLKDGPAEKMTKLDFETSRKNSMAQFGKIKNFRYLTSLKTPAVKNLIWVVTFERKDSDGKVIEQELLFRLVTGVLDEKSVVLSFGFL